MTELELWDRFYAGSKYWQKWLHGRRRFLLALAKYSRAA